MKELTESHPDALATAAEVLLNGGVAAIPTETVYGLMTVYDNAAGRDKIYQLKHRPASKQLQMLAPSVDVAIKYGVQDSPELRRLAKCFWPGGLTVVVPNADKSDTIGLRIPNHPFVLQLLNQCNCVLAATSANRSGEPPAINIHDAIKNLDGTPDLAIDGGVITTTDGKASTVVSLLNSTPTLLREGNITLAQLQQALK